jgi:hypothetical protein
MNDQSGLPLIRADIEVTSKFFPDWAERIVNGFDHHRDRLQTTNRIVLVHSVNRHPGLREVDDDLLRLIPQFFLSGFLCEEFHNTYL